MHFFLVKGYDQIPVAEADISKTAKVTPFGLFEYVAMPFGLRNVAQTFQRLMDCLFSQYGLVFVYLDDILLTSQPREEHLLHNVAHPGARASRRIISS